ncbi:hypothetical protein KIH31_09695 [Paenarthrobacter sp. DKR-5]|uniref:hypothetical protein n=1 Tax=Paenarthrobacter sp. DKR-5 TaxID=2835535 RepID=UPI001BDBC8AE|nr:hypothetical protein [Paenarthrobacter sp. DKR-5]MBT1002878.1 hypothetical protein [Paenarthrobacter sp. DKR-5]
MAVVIPGRPHTDGSAAVDHHLRAGHRQRVFAMPRPYLHRAAAAVRACCREQGIPYTETSLLASYAILVRYLNEVGLSAGGPFECPVADQYRPR